MENSKKLAQLFGILSQEAEKTAHTLNEISECIGEADSGVKKAPAEKPAADVQNKPEKAEPAKAEEKAEEPVSKDAIHDLMVKLTLAKQTEQVKEVLSDYAPRLSKVKEADYPELFRRLKELEVK